MSAAPTDPVESFIVRDEAANCAGALPAEEAAGTIRWLRPDFQVPRSTQAVIGLEPGGSGRRNLSDGATSPPTPAQAPTATINWPNTLPEQLATLAAPLAVLEAPGRARRLDDGRWLG